jgi:HPt (histidine-containing phosphotransfer) domain-containing protein/HAMP domain-containing protein
MTGTARPSGGDRISASPTRRHTSIATKLAGAATALILVVTTVVYISLTRYQREALLHSKEVAAAAVSRLFADWCAAGVVFEDDLTIREALTTLGRNEEVEYAGVWVVDASGRSGRRLGELRRGIPEALTAVSPGMQILRRADRVVLSSPVRDQSGKIVAMAVAAFSLARENAAIIRVAHTTLALSIAVALGFILVIRLISRFAISIPLAKLVLAAKQLEEGRSGELDVQSNDEVGQLANAFRNMATAIRDREDRINAGNRNMRLVLDNVGQGFITLDPEGRMSPERSKVVDEWFGSADRGLPFWEYLRGTDATAAVWFELGWTALGEYVLPMELCLDQLPALVKKEGRTFELAYRPLLDKERLTRLIVVITEVTARIERERAEQVQREMMSIFRRILSDRAALDGFFTEADSLVVSLLEISASAEGEAGEKPDGGLLRRRLHTLKGNCALFGIESVAQLCHELEDLVGDSPRSLSAAEAQRLRAQWNEVKQMYGELTEGRSEIAVELDRGEYESFLSELRTRLGEDNLVATAMTWQFEPATKRLAVVGEQIRALAARLGKAVVEMVYEPTTLRLPPRKWGPFWSTFSHVVRNAVDHGLETGAERVAAGKTRNATVTLGLSCHKDEVVVTIHDDGRGIDWPKIEEKAKQLGLPHTTRAELEEALYSQGLSSRDEVTSTSGRGVGLGAVRDVVRDLGGRLEIQTDAGRGTTFRCYLPQAMLFDDVGGAGGLAHPRDEHRWAVPSLPSAGKETAALATYESESASESAAPGSAPV